MARVLLGVTGSVAAIHTPDLAADLFRAGHEVKVVASRAARYFFDPAQVDALGAADGPKSRIVWFDEDEWPGERYERGDPVLHIELRRWADVLLVAPCDAHTLARFALGLCDSCLTCVYRAWDRTRPVILAPAMNTLMWEHPATQRHLAQINEDLHAAFHLLAPISKRLACDDVGVGGMAERPALLACLASVLPTAGAEPSGSTARGCE